MKSREEMTLWNRILWRMGNVLIFFFVSTMLSVLILKWMPVYYTPLMGIRCFEQFTDGKEVKCHHKWVPLDSINHNLVLAAMGGEDTGFPHHHGFDEKEILKARLAAMEGGKERGASTISQQTAKNVFLWPGHSWIRKGLEAYFTVLIEIVWGKERIMEVYLNSIEMGVGIYGAEAVAHDNFGKHASQLTQRESATIAATFPLPLMRDSANPSAKVKRRASRIIKEMNYMSDPGWGCD